MAHELEMLANGQAATFYVGEVPWHGLGTKLDKPPTVEEGIKAAGLDWTVSKRPLFLADGVETPLFATVRDSDDRVLGSVLRRYTVLQNLEAFKWFQPFLDSGAATLETAGSLKEGRNVWVMAKIAGMEADILPGDPVHGYLLLSNSHDGTTTIRAGFSGIRVVCQNTLSLAHHHGNLVQIRHMSNAKDALDLVRDTMDLAGRIFTKSAEDMRRMINRTITDEMFEEYVVRVFFPKKEPKKELSEKEAEELVADALQEVNHQKLLNKIKPLWYAGRGVNIPGVRGTPWAAYNSVTVYLTWERGGSNDNRLHSLWFGESEKTVARAFKEAQLLSA